MDYLKVYRDPQRSADHILRITDLRDAFFDYIVDDYFLIYYGV